MEQRADRLDLIELCSELSEVPLICHDKSVALKRITELGQRAMGSHACTLALVDLQARTLVQVACTGFDETYERTMTNRPLRLGPFPEEGHLDYDQVAAARMVEVYDLQSDGQGVANPAIARRYGLQAALCCPLIWQGQLVGYFNHFSAQPDRFSMDDKRLIQAFARHAVLSIEILENLNKLGSHDRLVQLNQIMQEMTALRSVDRLLELILEEGLALVGCQRGWISRLDPGQGVLRIVAQKGDPIHPRGLPVGCGMTGKALELGMPLRADDVRENRWAGIYEEFWPDTRSELAVPILNPSAQVRVRRNVELGRKPIGVFNAESPQTGAFSTAHESLLWSLARHAGILIDRLELDRKLSNLDRIRQEMVGRLDREDILDIMSRAITDTLGYDYVNISLVDDERKSIQTVHITGLALKDYLDYKQMADHPLDGDDIQADIVRSQQIEVPDAEDPRFDPAIYRRFGHERLIRVYIPMIAPSDSRVLGTVEAGYQRLYRQHIYEQDVQILKSFVDYAVRTLEPAQRGLLDRLRHELRVPIVGMRNNASFLQRRWPQLDPGLIEHKFDDILADTEILLQLIHELEYILGSPSTAGKVQRTLVFRDVIIKTVRQLKPLMAGYKLDPNRVEYSPDAVRRVSPLYVERAKLNQVVYNLLVNAIKYAEEDPGQFMIRIEASQTRDAFVVVFKDWGIGIQSEYADQVFERGFRAPQAKVRDVTGSGLGLTIAQEIMRNMGGDLRLVHTCKPTEFHVVLPKRLMEVPYDNARR